MIKEVPAQPATAGSQAQTVVSWNILRSNGVLDLGQGARSYLNRDHLLNKLAAVSPDDNRNTQKIIF